jgi:transposase-like protein
VALVAPLTSSPSERLLEYESVLVWWSPRRDQRDVAYAVVELADARDGLRTTALTVLSDGATTSAALRERLQIGTQAIELALQHLTDIQARLQEHLAAPGLPVSEAARYLGVSEPTVRAWLARGALTAVPEAKPVLVDIPSLRRVGHALAELRERGRDRDWTRALVDLLHDHAERRRPELLEGLDELRRGELEPA